MIVNEFGSSLISTLRLLITGLIDFWNNYLNYPLFNVSFEGQTYTVTVLFALTALGLLIIITFKVVDLVIPI